MEQVLVEQLKLKQLHSEDISILDLRFVNQLIKILFNRVIKKYNEWYVFSDSQNKVELLVLFLKF